MGRTNAIARLNTEEIVNEVNNVIKKGLDKLLGDHLYRYELLERTHDAIMNLPNVRNHLNQNPYDTTEYKCVKEEHTKNDLDMMKYGLLIEKLTIRIDELTNEVSKLKKMTVNDVVKPQDEMCEENIDVVKLEPGLQSVASATVTPLSQSLLASGYSALVENSAPGNRVATVLLEARSSMSLADRWVQ